MALLFQYFLSLFPAYAGVIPDGNETGDLVAAFPRIRGGDPDVNLASWIVEIFSPHTRG